MNIAETSAAVRIYHQWLPDNIRVEKNLSKDTAMGSTQTILKNEQGFYGASEPRQPAALSLGY